MSEIETLMKASPPVVLGVFLTAVGWLLRQSQVKNWKIPWILPVIGGIMYPLVAETATLQYAVHSPLAYNMMIGVIAGAGAVGFNQAIWQYKTRHEDGAATTIKPKDPTP